MRDDNVLLPGRLLFPSEFVIDLGLPRESKKDLYRVPDTRLLDFGIPLISMIQDNKSGSFSPGKSGYPL